MNLVKDISIVIPVFNAENSLSILHEQLIETLRTTNKSFEIIFVDDKSYDKSWEIIEKLKNSDPNVKGIKLGKNFGQHNATLCGISRANGNIIITIDDDLQSKPSDIVLLLERHKQTDADLVYAEYTNSSSGIFRKLLRGFYKLVLRNVISKNSGRGSSFRLISRKLANQLINHYEEFVFIDELCLWYTDRIEFIKTQKHKSIRKKSNYSNFRLTLMSGELAMFSSVLPLRLVTFVGGILSSATFLLGTYYIVKKFLLKIEVEGYTSLIVSILFSTGVILLALGIIAEYLSKILKSQYRKPAFYIEKEI